MFDGQPRLISVKTPAELEGMKKAGRLASQCLEWICGQVAAGMSTQDIDDLQKDFADRHKVVCAPLNYKGFPKRICTSINDVICHGIPSRKAVLKEGDIVGIDVTLIVEGFHGDNAATIPVGKTDEKARALVAAALEANRLGIEAVKAGARLGDIGHAIQSYSEARGFSVVRDFTGHGIGRKFHEEPQVLHYGKAGRGQRLPEGLTLTIEPMINAGGWESRVLEDGWTAVTADGSLSAQFEHTLAVTQDGYRVMTVQNGDGAWEPPGRVTI